MYFFYLPHILWPSVLFFFRLLLFFFFIILSVVWCYIIISAKPRCEFARTHDLHQAEQEPANGCKSNKMAFINMSPFKRIISYNVVEFINRHSICRRWAVWLSLSLSTYVYILYMYMLRLWGTKRVGGGCVLMCTVDIWNEPPLIDAGQGINLFYANLMFEWWELSLHGERRQFKFRN